MIRRGGSLVGRPAIVDGSMADVMVAAIDQTAGLAVV